MRLFLKLRFYSHFKVTCLTDLFLFRSGNLFQLELMTSNSAFLISLNPPESTPTLSAARGKCLRASKRLLVFS